MFAPLVLALHFLGGPGVKASPRVYELARTPRYAVIKFDGGRLENRTFDGQLLAEHFPFGWELIGISLNRSSVPKWNAAHVPPHDAGPRADVNAVRALLARKVQIYPSVRIAGGYALAEWQGNGGGQTLFRKSGHTWRQIVSGGGAMNVQNLRSYGVPDAAARVLLARR